MEINYSNDAPPIDSFYALYESTGWNTEAERTKEELYEAIKNSWYLVSAFYENELIGFGRIISDGKLHAFIVDLIILPNFQKIGLGKEILNRLVYRLKQDNITDIQLFCAKGKKEFYLKNNFTERPIDAPGMQYNSNDQ